MTLTQEANKLTRVSNTHFIGVKVISVLTVRIVIHHTFEPLFNIGVFAKKFGTQGNVHICCRLILPS